MMVNIMVLPSQGEESLPVGGYGLMVQDITRQAVAHVTSKAKACCHKE